jgi:uncharacterized membrane protein
MLVKLYVITLPLFVALDMAWLGLVAKNFYAKQIGFLMKTHVNWLAAILFYLLFVLGLVIFVVAPALKDGSWQRALMLGALFGLVSYATYDLTNLATIKNWPLLVTGVDLIWGACIASSVSVMSFFVANKLGL